MTIPVAGEPETARAAGLRRREGGRLEPSPRLAVIVHVLELPAEAAWICRWLTGIALHSDRRRFRHAVVSLGPRTTLHSALERAGVQTHALGAAGKREYPRAVVELRRYLRRQRADIVQTHFFYPSVLGLVGASAARTRVRIVTRHHSDFTTEFHHPLHRQADRLQALWSDRVIAASDAVKRAMIDLEHVPSSKIAVARYAYDFNSLQPVLSGPERLALRRQLAGKDATILVTVARLYVSKGHRYLFEAMPAILSAHPSCRLLLLGNGPMREELTELARYHGIERAVSFLGWRGDAARIIEAADLVVHPSLHEAFCNVIIEAMALERPLVATNVAGAPEQVQNGASGILVPPRDSAALAEAVVSLLDDPARARAMGKEARRKVNEEFSFATMVALYESIYDELLSSAHRR